MTPQDDIQRTLGRLEGQLENLASEVRQLRAEQYQRFSEASTAREALQKQILKHNNQVHGADWRIVGGVVSGLTLVAGGIGALIKEWLTKGG